MNQMVADQLWPGSDALGKRLRIGSDTVSPATVIGVVANAAHDSQRGVLRPGIYLAGWQQTADSWDTYLLARTDGDPQLSAPALREAIRTMDPWLPAFDVRTFEQVRNAGNVGELKLLGILLSLFGGLALALAMIGMHGVVSYMVTERTREVGIRMALGATRRNVLGVFWRDALGLTTVGLSLGIVLAAAMAMVMRSTSPTSPLGDAAAFATAAVVLMGVAAVTGLHPARRAAAADPMTALRAD